MRTIPYAHNIPFLSSNGKERWVCKERVDTYTARENGHTYYIFLFRLQEKVDVSVVFWRCNERKHVSVGVSLQIYALTARPDGQVS